MTEAVTTPTEESASPYQAGAILEHEWGYEQTNIDYWLIVRRSGQWVWLVPIGKKNVQQTLFMQGTCEPDPTNVLDPKPIKRKVRTWGDQERGVTIERSYGWASLWDGRPSDWSNYH